jgi:hypothetical protein
VRFYGILANETEPEFTIQMRNGQPYLAEKMIGNFTGRSNLLDFTTYMFTSAPHVSVKSEIQLE